jgi:hypothetical protein
MKPTPMSVVGPKRTLVTVGSPPPFALSLSKGQAELVEAFAPRAKGFDKLSPNGDEAGLRYLSPNGSFADNELRLRAESRRPSHPRRSLMTRPHRH